MNFNPDLPLMSSNPDLPLDKASTIPSSWYFDQAVYDREKLMFFKSWQAVGRLDQVSEPGQYFTVEITEEPICVIKEEKVIRAFSNVCRHKAATLLEGCGQVNKIRCPYHGWTYDLQGKLRGVPEFEGVCNFARENNNLPEYLVNTWGPIVFITNYYKYFDLNDPFIHTDLSRFKFRARKTYELNCNWKVFVDNYLDGGYHVMSVHPGLAGVLDYKNYHTKVYQHSSVQISPIQKDEQIGDVRSGDNAYYWWLFPNFMVNIYENAMDTNLVLPLSPEKCRVIIDFYFTNQSEEFMQKSIEVGNQIQLEDIDICERTQKGLKSRTYNQGRYSVKREIGIHHFHKLLHSLI